VVSDGRSRGGRAIDWTGEHVVTRVHTARRRIDMEILRWQARLESRAVDRVLPWAIALVLGVVLTLLALARYRDLGTGPHLGFHLQALHLMDQDMTPVVSELGLDVFAVQAAFVFVLVARLTDVFPTAETLLVVQAVALSLAVVPLWRIGRQSANLRVGACSALAVAYCLHPSVHNLNLAGFHPEALAMPALFAAYLEAQKQRWWTVGLLTLVVVSARADLGLAVMALGLVLVTEDRRVPGWSLVAFGTSWFLAMALVVQPALGDGHYPHLDAFHAYGDGFLGVIGGMLSDPVAVVGDMFDRTSFEKVLLLIGPVLFLPLVRPRYVAPVLPLLALYLVADVPERGLGNPQQDVAVLAFVFIAATYALMRIGSRGIDRVLVDHRVLAVLALTAMMFFVRDAASTPYEDPWDWGRRDDVDQARVLATGFVDDYDRVLAHPAVFNLMAERETIRLLDDGTPFLPDPATVEGIDVVVFDGESSGWPHADVRAFGGAMAVLDFRERFERDGVRVYVRQPQMTDP